MLAAVMEGRKAIGAEMDPDTFAKAVARLKAHDAQGTLFDVPTGKPKQETLL